MIKFAVLLFGTPCENKTIRQSDGKCEQSLTQFFFHKGV